MTTTTVTSAHPGALRGLYAITPDNASLASLQSQLTPVLAHGVRLVQFRSKNGDATQRRTQGEALLALCHRHGAQLIVNDDVALAIAIGADGVHVGRDDLGNSTLAQIRQQLGHHRLLGVSCYDSLDLAAEAVAAGADYIAFGSMYVSATKPNAPRASLATARAARARFGVPVAVIGGITVDNAPPLLAAGADLLAVISDLFDAGDIGQRAAQYQSLFAESPVA